MQRWKCWYGGVQGLLTDMAIEGQRWCDPRSKGHELWPRPFSSALLIPVQCSGPGRAEGSVLDSYPVLDEPSLLTAEAEAAASPGNRV